MCLLREALRTGEYDYYWLISGQDFLLKPIKWIIETLETFSSLNYIDCFYGEAFEKRCQLYYPKWMIGRSFRAKICRKLWVKLTGGEKWTFPVMARKHQPVSKYYAGSSWWCMSGEFIRWAVQYLEVHPEYEKYFRNAICPDEEFFQTLFMISPFKNKKAAPVCYVDWSNLQNSPRILEEKDLEILQSSGKWIARKFDFNVDYGVIEKLEGLIRK
ncbi:MAG TPA: beta-1,6-N-acetylglucosaminyltransferase [Candidatus Blautia intestinavium]|nr:beta-1,6-N-acetylglucosaminyltransferase [Candidatus Blautia intestinavium]